MSLNPNTSGIYSQNEWDSKAVLKQAPDCFVVFNNSLSERMATYVAPGDVKASKNLSFKGGITSVNVSGAIRPAGSGTCSITIVCPQYEGLHQDYYVTLPNGVKAPYFTAMMEVKVFMKGRYLSTQSSTSSAGDSVAPGTPLYYQVFWGFISDFNESMSAGQVTFNLSCVDMLKWWDYHYQVLVAGALPNTLGWSGQNVSATGQGMSHFYNMNAWEIIYTLFQDTGFSQFVYPSFTQGDTALPTTTEAFEGLAPSAKAYRSLSESAMTHWKERFKFYQRSSTDTDSMNLTFLEMYGLMGLLDLRKDVDSKPIPASTTGTTRVGVEEVKDTVNTSKQGNSETYMRLKGSFEIGSNITLDFGILGLVKPFFAFDKYSAGVESTFESKLNLAQTSADNVKCEFYLDMNGRFVFKPPFYNMDVRGSRTYTLLPKDIISINESVNSSAIVNYYEVTGPMLYIVEGAPKISAIHVDFDSIARYGIRQKTDQLMYGNTSTQLYALAVGEMSAINAKATTASIEIPLRPELRLGYPVYIEHLDAFYYINGISHSFTFGAAATTSLTLESKREKVRAADGAPLTGFVYKRKPKEEAISDAKEVARKVDGKEATAATVAATVVPTDVESTAVPTADSNQVASVAPNTNPDTKVQQAPSPTDSYYRNTGFTQSLDTGFYAAVKSEAATKLEQRISSVVRVPTDATYVGESPEGVDVSELIQFTSDSIPFTDLAGYRHFGAFPYGANLRMTDEGGFEDITRANGFEQSDIALKANLAAAPEGAPTANPGGATPANTQATANSNPNADVSKVGTPQTPTPDVIGPLKDAAQVSKSSADSWADTMGMLKAAPTNPCVEPVKE